MAYQTKLCLKSGEVFYGESPEYLRGNFFGEVVFNTGMVGYPEALTDPSYIGQILVFTYPLIGNYGVPAPADWESDRIQVAGVVVSELAQHYSHHRAQQSLLDWLKEFNVPVMTGVDTRALTLALRKQGVRPGVICVDNPRQEFTDKDFIDINAEHLVKKVTVAKPSVSGEGEHTIIAVDCGMKTNIMRHLLASGYRIKRVPFDYDYMQEEFAGVFLSNGPGAPEQCTATIDILRRAMQTNKPIFGICLGAQLMALAAGARTYKLPFGHRAQNHPCMDLRTNRCYLTSQNHGFAIDEKSLPADWQVTFRHLNDHTVQGIQHSKKPFFAVQFHPEAAPGPTDPAYLFTEFFTAVNQHCHSQVAQAELNNHD